MNAGSDVQIKMFLDLSADDEAVLELPVSDGIFEFHTQQAVEKQLKALILGLGSAFQRTHDIEKLLEALRTLGEPMPAFEVPLQALTSFAINARYMYAMPLNDEERATYKRVVAAVGSHVRTRIAELQSALS